MIYYSLDQPYDRFLSIPRGKWNIEYLANNRWRVSPPYRQIALREGLKIIRQMRSYNPNSREQWRLHHPKTGNIIMADIL